MDLGGDMGTEGLSVMDVLLTKSRIASQRCNETRFMLYIISLGNTHSRAEPPTCMPETVLLSRLGLVGEVELGSRMYWWVKSNASLQQATLDWSRREIRYEWTQSRKNNLVLGGATTNAKNFVCCCQQTNFADIFPST